MKSGRAKASSYRLEMGIRFTCPNGHKLHVKTFLAGKRGVCPNCGAKFVIPTAEETQQASNHSSSETSEFRSALTQTQLEAGSPSIIIAIAEPSTSVALPVNIEVPASLSTEIDAPSDEFALPPPPAVPTIFLARDARQSPNSPVVAKRVRRQRSQLNFAILLLATVIVLALILIWVLRRGGSEANNEPVAIRIPHNTIVDFALSQREWELS